jgi:hypothetical protein
MTDAKVNATEAAPVFAPEPWYQSEVQVRAVVAIAAQVLSILLRIIKRYLDIHISDEDIELVTADVLQLVAIVFGGLAIIKRQRSPIQPLTLTKDGAEKRASTAQIDPRTLEKRAA